MMPGGRAVPVTRTQAVTAAVLTQGLGRRGRGGGGTAGGVSVRRRRVTITAGDGREWNLVS